MTLSDLSIFSRALATATLLGAAALAHAQPTTLDNPVGEYFEHRVDSGSIDHFGANPETMWVDLVTFEDAAWLRLYFGATDLPEGSYLRLTSLADEEVQELDARALAMWSDSSAYFNGSEVLVELVAGPGTRGNRVVIERVAAEFPHAGVTGDCGICGGDSRFPSDEPYAGRLVPVGCTATIWNPNGCIVTAGHCISGGLVMEFNVPPSNSDCTINHPPVEDQFPVVDIEFRNAGVGADWAVATTGTNNLGETIYDRYGVFVPIATSPASNGQPIDVWGYAIDSQCERSQVQQYSPDGSITSVRSSWYEYDADTTFGNSGSAIIRNGEIVGIVTHCSFGCPNFGTRVDNGDFESARIDLCAGDLELTGPVPGIAGQVNTLTTTNATAGAEVTFAYSLGTGSTDVPNCPGVTLELANAQIAGTAIADVDGTATLEAFVPGAAAGRAILLQSYETATCRVSSLLVARF